MFFHGQYKPNRIQNWTMTSVVSLNTSTKMIKW
jgi:hypothetical protein